MSIGAFARSARLSPKALRLYDELGLLLPARVDEASGYRFYAPSQLKTARLISALRQLQVPLAEITAILAAEPADAAERVRTFWAATEAENATRRALATYLIDELSGTRSVLYEVNTREIPERSLLCVKRNVLGQGEAWAFGKEFIEVLRRSRLPEIPGRAGAFFCIYWGEVSDDSDGPMEWCRPIPTDDAEALADHCPELTLRAEVAHNEAFVNFGNGQSAVAEWHLVEQSLHAWSEQQLGVVAVDLGMRITFLPSEVGQSTYQDFAIPYMAEPRR